VSESGERWADDWQLKLRVWVERQGEAVLSDGRLELLEWIDRCRSISEAARRVGVSYRHAWVQVQEAGRAAGEPLVEAVTGGHGGGGARLTARGREAVVLFRRLRDHLRREAAALLPRLRGPSLTAEAIHVAAAVSLEDVLGQLATDYALLRPGAHVRVVLGASDELVDQVLAGALPDLILAADPAQLDRLAQAGRIAAGSITPLAANTLAAIAPADTDLAARRPADLLVPSVARVAMAAPSCPLGGYTRAYLERLGLYDAFTRRAVLVDHSRAVVAAVQAGQADAGLVYGNAAAAAAGCRELFRVRRPAVAIRYGGAVLLGAAQPERAREFLEFLASAAARRRFRRCGFLPVRD
jgi:molybdate transport system substrate-binding protein